MDYVTMVVEWLGADGRAVLLRPVDGEAEWVPLSCIEEGSSIGPVPVGTEIVVSIESWKAKELGWD